MDLGLAGRVVLVSGSSRGIGRRIAARFAEEGANIVITYHEDCEAADSIAQEIRLLGTEAIVSRFDLSDKDSISSGVHAAINQWGRLDVLVNNAVDFPMHARDRMIDDPSPFEWQRLLRNNVEGAYIAIQAAVPAMRGNKWGRILNVSSVAATDGMPGFTWYSAAKSALHGMTRSLAKELGPAGILVNVLMAGATLTDRIQGSFAPQRLEAIAQTLPIRRLPLPDELASVAVFLCSERNSTITGEIIRASGGRK